MESCGAAAGAFFLATVIHCRFDFSGKSIGHPGHLGRSQVWGIPHYPAAFHAPELQNPMMYLAALAAIIVEGPGVAADYRVDAVLGPQHRLPATLELSRKFRGLDLSLDPGDYRTVGLVDYAPAFIRFSPAMFAGFIVSTGHQV